MTLRARLAAVLWRLVVRLVGAPGARALAAASPPLLPPAGGPRGPYRIPEHSQEPEPPRRWATAAPPDPRRELAFSPPKPWSDSCPFCDTPTKMFSGSRAPRAVVVEQLCVPFHRVMTTEGKCSLRGNRHLHRTCLRCEGRWVSALRHISDGLPDGCPACRGRDSQQVALLEARVGDAAVLLLERNHVDT